MNETALAAQAANQIIPIELTMNRRPDVVLREAEVAAAALMELVDKKKLFKVIGSNKHLFVEAWETVGHFYRCQARIVTCEYVEFGESEGFKAAADVVHLDSGLVIGHEFGYCMTDEDDWFERPKYEYPNGTKTQVGMEPVPHYARAGMAQTRARSRAYRSVFDHVVVLAGFNPTPAEEMPDRPGSRKEPLKQPQSTDAKPAGEKPANGGGLLITEPQGKRLWAKWKDSGKGQAELDAILAKYGYQSTQQIERSNYDAICSEVEKQR